MVKVVSTAGLSGMGKLNPGSFDEACGWNMFGFEIAREARLEAGRVKSKRKREKAKRKGGKG
jgi:hypothetical protein